MLWVAHTRRIWMTTTVCIELLTLDPRLRMQVEDEINTKYLIFTPSLDGKLLTVPVDAEVTRELIIECLSEGVLEYIGDIYIKNGTPKPKKIEDNPFVTADRLL